MTTIPSIGGRQGRNGALLHNLGLHSNQHISAIPGIINPLQLPYNLQPAVCIFPAYSNVNFGSSGGLISLGSANTRAVDNRGFRVGTASNSANNGITVPYTGRSFVGQGDFTVWWRGRSGTVALNNVCVERPSDGTTAYAWTLKTTGAGTALRLSAVNGAGTTFTGSNSVTIASNTNYNLFVTYISSTGVMELWNGATSSGGNLTVTGGIRNPLSGYGVNCTSIGTNSWGGACTSFMAWNRFLNSTERAAVLRHPVGFTARQNRIPWRGYNYTSSGIAGHYFFFS